jgi:hypothetical protein
MGRPWRVGHAWEACAWERRGLGLESGSGTTRRKGMISGSRLSVAAGEGWGVVGRQRCWVVGPQCNAGLPRG